MAGNFCRRFSGGSANFDNLKRKSSNLENGLWIYFSFFKKGNYFRKIKEVFMIIKKCFLFEHNFLSYQTPKYRKKMFSKKKFYVETKAVFDVNVNRFRQAANDFHNIP
jgi:mRNA-degrading endonuclease HigB of HigAB toxin-antitoxin module